MSLILSTAAMLALLTGQGTATIEPRLMRYPTIHGDTVVFSYAGDLWVAAVGGGTARRLTSHPGLEIRPHISPDGKTVAFTGSYEGPANIYSVPIDGGEPKRLTYDTESDNCLAWTPDGKIAYGSTAGNFVDRQQRLWLIDPDGGLPQRTQIKEVAELSYLSDGKSIVYNRFASAGFNWRHYRGGTQGRISLYNLTTNAYSELPSDREQSYYPMAVGRSVYYISDRGTGVLNLFRYDLDSKRDTQITKFADADIRTPSTDGKTIVFERNGYLYAFDIASGKISQPQVRILGENLSARPYLRSVADQISDVTISPTGTRIAVEARGEIFSVPVRQGDTRNMTQTSGARERFPRWSPDGKVIAYVSDASGGYEVYTRPQLGGDPTQITTNTPGTIESIEWSPDGKTIQIQKSDSSIWHLDVSSKRMTKILDAPYGISGMDWSSDSQWLAYVKNGRNGQGALYLYEVSTGKTTMVDSGYFDDSQVAFDMNGKYLYITSNRDFTVAGQNAIQTPTAQARGRLYVIPLAKDTPNPLTVTSDEEPESGGGASAPRPLRQDQVARPGGLGGPGGSGGPGGPSGPPAPAATKIDIDGLADRLIPLPLAPGGFGGLIGSTNGVFFTSNGALNRFDLSSREAAPILVFAGGAGRGGGSYTFNPNRTKLAYASGGVLGVIDIRPGPPAAAGQGRVDTSAVETLINPREEWKQIFWEAWRFERDHYYDPKMRGLNWPAIGRNYGEFLQYVNSRQDLNYVIGLMIGELGTSHAYVSGGDLGANASRPIPVGYLGADYEPAGGHLRFAKIYRGHSFEEAVRAPLTEPGIDVKEGGYLLEINGKPVTANTNPNALLLGQVGRYVTLKVNSSPTDAGARTVRVRPVISEGQIRYWDFVDTNRAMVDKLSNGRIGYVHVRDTGPQGAIDLTRGYLGQTQKDAIIVDERWNGGGNLPTGFTELVGRRAQFGIQSRNRGDLADAFAVEGPKAMLINGYAGSGGDAFPWLFKKQNLGPLIGKRTWGGLVGYNQPLDTIDGGMVTSPEASMFDLTTGEIIAENTGVTPDIDVDLRPDLAAKGQDPQLEAAIKYLQAQLAKMPPKKERANTPTVNKNGRIGG